MLLTVFGPNTIIGGLGSDAGYPLTLSFAGIVLAQVFVSSPFYIIFARSAFEGIPRRYEDAARTLGHNKLQTFLTVSLPMAKKGIVVGATIAWLRAVGELGATMMMAYNPHTVSIQIWEDTFVGGTAKAFPIVIVIVLLTVCLILLLTRFARWTGVLDGKGGG
jgi:molybdate/tungstate transport system permease protein